MIARRIVRRYAAALYQTAAGTDAVDRVESDLGLVSYALEISPELGEALESPKVFSDRKKAVVRDIFADKVHQITLSYLYLLIDKRREEVLAFTEEEYIRIANEARGILEVRVSTAVRMTEEEEARLKAKLTARTGKSIRLEKHVSPELIGGMTVRIGDTVIDGSVKGYLASLRERLMG